MRELELAAEALRAAPSSGGWSPGVECEGMGGPLPAVGAAPGWGGGQVAMAAWVLLVMLCLAWHCGVLRGFGKGV